jgi:hypothetical protein
MKGKWAQGIKPRNFAWIIRDKLAVSERPGGYGANHRRVRRQEEIIWLREQGFSYVVSLIPSPHNLHNYDELGLPYLHRPFGQQEDAKRFLRSLYPELASHLRNGGRLLIHQEELGDRVAGVVAGYLLWAGLVPTGPQTVAIVEQLVQRQMGPVGRSLVAVAAQLQDEPKGA